MKQGQLNMRPQDVLILLKIVSAKTHEWFHHTIAEDLFISQSEVTQSLNRSKYSGLIDAARKNVNGKALLDFLQYGVPYVFPQQPGPVVRGVATAHSAPPLNAIIESKEQYVWPSARGKIRGQAIEPLYKSVVKAVQTDPNLYDMLALVDAIRVGRVREKQIAIEELKKRIL